MGLVVAITNPTLDELFEEFWAAYPKKVGKAMAKSKWLKITNGGMTTSTLDKDSGTRETLTHQATPQDIIAGAKRFRTSQTDPMTYKVIDGGKYCPEPCRWLNQGRWQD